MTKLNDMTKAQAREQINKDVERYLKRKGLITVGKPTPVKPKPKGKPKRLRTSYEIWLAEHEARVSK